MSANHSKKGGLATIFLTVLIDLLGFGIVIPLLPIYSQAYGASGVELGLLFASFSAMQFLFAPLWGRLSDRIGRKPVILCGLVGTSLSYVAFGLAESMTALFVARLAAGFFGANVSTAQAYIADVTEEKDRAKGMGMIGAAFGLGFTLGPLVGGELAQVSMGMPGFFAAGLSAVAAIYGFVRLVEPERHRGDSSRRFGLQAIRRAFADGRTSTLLLLYFLAIFAFAGFESMFIRFGLARFPAIFGVPEAIGDATMEQILAAAPIAGRTMFFIGLMSALIQGGLIRRLVPRFGEVNLIVVGPLLLGLSFFILGLAPTWTVVILGCVLLPIGFGLNNPSLQGLLSRSVSSDAQGSVLGINQSLASLARVLGPAVAGAAFVGLGPSSPLLLSGAILMVATLVAVLYRRRYGAGPEADPLPETPFSSNPKGP